MRMKEGHMLNEQLKPGYNIQVAVETEYIVGMDIFSSRTDVNTSKSKDRIFTIKHRLQCK